MAPNRNDNLSNEKKIAVIEKIKGKKGRPKKTNKTGGAPFLRDNIIEYKKTSHSNTMQNGILSYLMNKNSGK